MHYTRTPAGLRAAPPTPIVIPHALTLQSTRRTRTPKHRNTHSVPACAHELKIATHVRKHVHTQLPCTCTNTHTHTHPAHGTHIYIPHTAHSPTRHTHEQRFGGGGVALRTPGRPQTAHTHSHTRARAHTHTHTHTHV